MRAFFGIFLAVLLHVGVILFGGLLFTSLQKEQPKKPMLVDLFTPEASAKEKDKEKPKEEPKEPVQEIEKDKPPDAAKEAEKLDQALRQELTAAEPPALEQMSLGAIESALNGQVGSGAFGEAVSFASGGIIGGHGRGGAAEEEEAGTFGLADVEQKPRAIFQAAPVYPAAMHGKKVEGVVSIIFIVDPTGRVTNQRVEKSSNLAFDKPALDAVRQWKFEPGVKGGQRVACKMRVAVRFQPS